MESGARRFCSCVSGVLHSTTLDVTPRMRAVFSARSMKRDIQKMRSPTLESMKEWLVTRFSWLVTAAPRSPLSSFRLPPSAFRLPPSIDYPRILGPPALRGIDDQRSLLQRDARQSARNELHLAPGEHERAQVEVARGDALVDVGRARGERERGLGDVVPRVGAYTLAERLDRFVAGGRSDQHAVAARPLHFLDDELRQVLEHVAQVVGIAQLPGGHVLQERLLAQVEADH